MLILTASSRPLRGDGRRWSAPSFTGHRRLFPNLIAGFANIEIDADATCGVRKASQSGPPEMSFRCVPEKRAKDGTERADQNSERQPERSLCGEEARQRHHQFGGYRRKDILQQHEGRDADISGI